MKRCQSLMSILFAVLLIISAVVFPAARERVSLNVGAPQRSADHITVCDAPEQPSSAAGDAILAQTLPEDRSAPDASPCAAESPSENGGEAASDALSVPSAEAACGPAVSDAATVPSAEAKGGPAVPEAAVAAPAAQGVSRSDGDAPTEAAPSRSSRRDGYVIPTIDTLIPLSFGEDHAAVLSSVDERHIYTFTVAGRGFLQYTVSHAEQHDFMGWQATLYRAYYLNGVNGEIGYMPLNVLTTTALATADASPTVGLMQGEYRIVVKATAGSSAEEYRLNAVFTPATDHEIECNDAKTAYTELYPGIPMVGSASCYEDRQDDDWYLLRVQKDGTAHITFTHAKIDNISVAWRIALYDEAGGELYAENSGMNTELVDSGEIGLRAGVYFVAVLCRARCDGDYTLTVTTVADDRFEREENDTRETATPLALGGMVSGCVTAKAGRLDRDFYRFVMPSRGNFSLVFTHAPAALKNDKNGWQIRLFSSSDELLYTLISTWNASSDRMPVLGLEAGVYYVEVSSEDMYRSTLTYTLIAGYNESAGFEQEPNNTPQTANPIAQGVPVTGAIINAADPDDDYYVFLVSAYSRVTVTLTHEAIAGDRDIFSFSVCDAAGVKAPLYTGRELLTDASGGSVYYVKSLAGQQSAVGYYELTPGTYYIKVTSGRFFDSINYNIAYYLN